MGSNNLHAFYVLVGQGGLRPPVQVDGKMHVDCWIQQVTATVGAVTCWIQQVTAIVGAVTCWIQHPVYFKYAVGFSSAFNKQSVSSTPDSISYNAAISACEKGGYWELALELLNECKTWIRNIEMGPRVNGPQHFKKYVPLIPISSQWMEVGCPIGMRLWMNQL